MTYTSWGSRAVGRTGFVLTVSKTAGDGPVIEAIPEFEYHPPYTRTLSALQRSTGPVNTVLWFNSSGEERVVQVGDNAVICTPCAVWMWLLLKKQGVGAKKDVWGAVKCEMHCTAEVEESSAEWAMMQASGRLCCRFQPVEVVYYYERRPEDRGVLRCQLGQKLEFHNGWWEDGKLIVEDR